MFTSEVALADLLQSELTDHRARAKYSFEFVANRSAADYRAPELWMGDVEYGSPVDIWAIGAVTAYAHWGWDMFQPGVRSLAASMNRICEVLGYPHPNVAKRMKALPGYSPSRLRNVSWWSEDKEWHEDDIFDSLLYQTLAGSRKTWRLWEFMGPCLQWDPSRRPPAATALSNELFSDVPLSVVIGGRPSAFVMFGLGPQGNHRLL